MSTVSYGFNSQGQHQPVVQEIKELNEDSPVRAEKSNLQLNIKSYKVIEEEKYPEEEYMDRRYSYDPRNLQPRFQKS